MKKKHDLIPVMGCGLLVVPAIYILLLQPFSPALSEMGQSALAGLLITIGIWIFKPFGLSFSMGGAFLAGFLMICGLPASVVFAGFTQSALWTLIPALFFGYVLQKTGLGRRIALAIIRLFPPSYFAMILAWVLIGVILSILTPSITVRVAIVIPIAVHCCELFDVEKGSKGNSLLLLVAFAMALLPGTGWLNGSLWGPIVQGLYHAVPEMEGMVTFSSWMQAVFLPMEIATILLVVFGYMALRPATGLSKEAASQLKMHNASPMSSQEKSTAVILVSVFLLFSTNSIHKIPDAAVCMLALVAFMVFGVIDSKEISTGISWDLVVFIGMALGLGTVFSTTGISAWLSNVVVGAMEPISGNPWLFVFVVVILMFVWRFVDVAILIPTMAILTPVLPAVFQAYGIHPLIWLTIYVMSGNSFFLAYQNMWALMSQSIAGERSWTVRHLGIFGSAYFAACLIALIVAIPYWMHIGLL